MSIRKPLNPRLRFIGPDEITGTGSETPVDAQQTGETSGEQQQQQTDANARESEGQSGTTDDAAPWTKENFDPQRAWNLTQNLRNDLTSVRERQEEAVREAAEQAAARTRDELAQQFGTVLGLVKTDENDGTAETPTVESLTEVLQQTTATVQQKDTTIHSLSAENAVLRFAPAIGGDVDALLDSRDFSQKLAGIDLSANDYKAQVAALVKKEVEGNARYRKVQVAPANSNGEQTHTGSSIEPVSSVDKFREDYRKQRGL